jgi:hemerythrin superfamily protein
MNRLNDDTLNDDGDSDGVMGNPAGIGVDALMLLREDHQDVQELFDAYRDAVETSADDGRRRELAGEICALLEIHALIEEELFYPAARDALADADLLLDRAEVAHAAAKDLIDQLLAMDPDDASYDAKVLVLGDYVALHIREEEDEIFPRIETSEIDLDELGTELQARRAELEQDSDL